MSGLIGGSLVVALVDQVDGHTKVRRVDPQPVGCSHCHPDAVRRPRGIARARRAHLPDLDPIINPHSGPTDESTALLNRWPRLLGTECNPIGLSGIADEPERPGWEGWCPGLRPQSRVSDNTPQAYRKKGPLHARASNVGVHFIGTNGWHQRMCRSWGHHQKYNPPVRHWAIGRSVAVGILAVLLGAGVCVLGCGVQQGDDIAHPVLTVASVDKHRGVAFEHAWGRAASTSGYGTDASARSLDHLRELGVNWITLTPFGFQRDPSAPSFRWRRTRDGTSDTHQTDTRLRLATAQAHARGMRVMLKPHIWLRPPAWVGMVEPRTDDDRAAWFETYEAFITHYARLANEIGIEALCIGNELSRTTHYESEWRQLIAAIRAVYSGRLTYGAHMDEVSSVPFWDALDAIGVSAYFPVGRARSPSHDDLVAGWAPITVRLGRLSARHDRPVLFTEIGYRSVDYATRHPWKYDHQPPINLQLQASAYAAFFDAVWTQRWFAGVYWWKWRSSLDDGGPSDSDYTPRGKPAENILRRYFKIGR